MLMKIWRRGNPHTLLVGMRIGAATVENGPKASQKLKIELSYDPAISLLGTYLKKKKRNQNTNSKRYMHCSVYSNIIYGCQDIEAT